MRNFIPKIHRWGTAGLILLEAVYSLGWVVLVLLNRSGVDISPVVGLDTARALLEISFAQDFLLFAAASSVWTAFALYAGRTRGAALAYLLAIVFSKADWVVMALQSFERMAVEGYVSLIYQILVLGLLISRPRNPQPT